MAKQRIVNARNAPPPGRRGKEEQRGPVEFSDRYTGPQTRIQTEGQRSAAPQSRRSVAKGGVPAGLRGPTVTTSQGQKERVTSPTLATMRQTTPAAETTSTGELRRRQQPEAQQSPRAIGQRERPKLQETLPREQIGNKPSQTAPVETAAQRQARKSALISPNPPTRDVRIGLNLVDDPIGGRRRATR